MLRPRRLDRRVQLLRGCPRWTRQTTTMSVPQQGVEVVAAAEVSEQPQTQVCAVLSMASPRSPGRPPRHPIAQVAAVAAAAADVVAVVAASLTLAPTTGAASHAA